MKKIINDKLYDTDTATKLAMRGELGFKDALYRKKNDEFFIATSHTLTDPAICIEPLSEKETKKWVGNYGTVELYTTLFGDVSE